MFYNVQHTYRLFIRPTVVVTFVSSGFQGERKQTCCLNSSANATLSCQSRLIGFSETRGHFFKRLRHRKYKMIINSRRTKFTCSPHFVFYYFSHCPSAAHQIKEEKRLSQQTDLFFYCGPLWDIQPLVIWLLDAQHCSARSTRIYDCKVHFCEITHQFKLSVNILKAVLSADEQSYVSLKFYKCFDCGDIGLDIVSRLSQRCCFRSTLGLDTTPPDYW